jgi:hypothetical protein
MIRQKQPIRVKERNRRIRKVKKYGYIFITLCIVAVIAKLVFNHLTII